MEELPKFQRDIVLVDDGVTGLTLLIGCLWDFWDFHFIIHFLYPFNKYTPPHTNTMGCSYLSLIFLMLLSLCLLLPFILISYSNSDPPPKETLDKTRRAKRVKFHMYPRLCFVVFWIFWRGGEALELTEIERKALINRSLV